MRDQELEHFNETQWQLNTVSQLTDCKQLHDVLSRTLEMRMGWTLSECEFRMNAIGDRLRIDRSGQPRWNTYMATRTSDKKTLVINLILTAEQISA